MNFGTRWISSCCSVGTFIRRCKIMIVLQKIEAIATNGERSENEPVKEAVFELFQFSHPLVPRTNYRSMFDCRKDDAKRLFEACYKRFIGEINRHINSFRMSYVKNDFVSRCLATRMASDICLIIQSIRLWSWWILRMDVPFFLESVDQREIDGLISSALSWIQSRVKESFIQFAKKKI